MMKVLTFSIRGGMNWVGKVAYPLSLSTIIYALPIVSKIEPRMVDMF